MRKKLCLKVVSVFFIFTVLLYYNYFLTNKLNREKIKLDKMQTNIILNDKQNSKEKKIEYDFILKKAQELENLNFSIGNLNLSDKNLNIELYYKGNIDEFNKEVKIKKFFDENKEFNIESVIFNKNRVILNMDYIESFQ